MKKTSTSLLNCNWNNAESLCEDKILFCICSFKTIVADKTAVAFPSEARVD